MVARCALIRDAKNVPMGPLNQNRPWAKIAQGLFLYGVPNRI